MVSNFRLEIGVGLTFSTRFSDAFFCLAGVGPPRSHCDMADVDHGRRASTLTRGSLWSGIVLPGSGELQQDKQVGRQSAPEDYFFAAPRII